jgi:predicted dehydrogenase
VVAATPQVHSDIAGLAMARGVHVFVEKPPAASTPELTRLAGMAAEKNIITKVGHNLRHSAAYLELCNVVDPGTATIFDVRYITSGPRGDRWNLNSPIRSFLLSHAIHVVDLVLHALGEPVAVSANACHFENGGLLVSGRLSFPNGRLSTIVIGDVGTSFQFDAWAMSSEGLIVHIDSLRSVWCKGLSIKGRRWSEVWTPRPLEAGHKLAGYAGELEEFFAAIASGGRSSPSLAEEIATYKVIDEIHAQIQ